MADANPTVPAPPIEATDPASSSKSSVTMRRASDIRPLIVEWLWRGRIPPGMLTLLAGDPKLGKSFVTMAMAAAVSRGSSMPDGDQPESPGSVIRARG